ncbi:exonuclease domain-containing protein [Effusibacillus lacus]|uniref:Or 3'-5' exonuclease KapD n=1 Tax=Effusibacillus lacus TaxID=1348429 RepID=A0A292YRM8_9BACL|nr:exonuclease domain-containing protein [Effusibacillus lacus]TCS75747.1 exonuclease [Effusibacillus lacus]GAX91064.1 or 3'-5' exonuclease KapD [Effusibacillus lacus]
MIHQYLFIDFEFTIQEDDRKRRDFFQEFLEVGIVSVLDNEVYETYNSFVKPELNPVLTGRCKDFLEIAQEDVDGGISFDNLSAS